ncbi:elongation factor P [Sneathiella sp. P13V-1]|uniref:elongation factor P n=1 Tax=Sneathiella sp. P13V-1 TaxID=2697366 RepID=UPI00187B9C30|nr:elongation factor P [Sneathiella sp. P13V-1]MBE7637987.1 elongation factor P [Sneathiella sp. P13V-1]
MKINGNAIRPGNVIEHKGGLWVAVKIQHTQPGKGGAYLQVELKNLRDGTKLNERFRSSETVERARLEQKDHQFLFADDDFFTFMNVEDYEQVTIAADLVGDKAQFLQDGMQVEIEFYEDEALNVLLPENVTLEISETEPTVKGQTAASSYKPAILENGMRIMVPPFCNTGEKIVVNTETAEYSKRAD